MKASCRCVFFDQHRVFKSSFAKSEFLTFLADLANTWSRFPQGNSQLELSGGCPCGRHTHTLARGTPRFLIFIPSHLHLPTAHLTGEETNVWKGRRIIQGQAFIYHQSWDKNPDLSIPLYYLVSITQCHSTLIHTWFLEENFHLVFREFSKAIELHTVINYSSLQHKHVAASGDLINGHFAKLPIAIKKTSLSMATFNLGGQWLSVLGY